MNDIFRMNADIGKTFSNAKRLEIINSLRSGELSAGELIKITRMSKANLSQHMSFLMGKGIVRGRREGINMIYELSDSRVVRVCDLMRKVVERRHEKTGKLILRAKNGR